MSEHIHKSHNVSALLYHLVFPTKYRRAVITDEVESVLRKICFDISNRYEITFLEIGTDKDHVHCLNSHCASPLRNIDKKMGKEITGGEWP